VQSEISGLIDRLTALEARFDNYTKSLDKSADDKHVVSSTRMIFQVVINVVCNTNQTWRDGIVQADAIAKVLVPPNDDADSASVVGGPWYDGENPLGYGVDRVARYVIHVRSKLTEKPDKGFTNEDFIVPFMQDRVMDVTKLVKDVNIYVASVGMFPYDWSINHTVLVELSTIQKLMKPEEFVPRLKPHNWKKGNIWHISYNGVYPTPVTYY